MEDNKKQVTENPEVTADQTPNESPNSVSGDVAQQGTSSTPSSEPVANTDSSTLDEQLKAATDGETVQESVSEEPASYDENMTMEDVMAASDKQMGKPPVHRGKIITGKIIMLANDGLIVDVGAKIEGLLPYTQLADTETTKEAAAKEYKSGDTILAYVVRADISNGVIILSKKRAEQEKTWNLLKSFHEKALPLEVDIIEKVKGGLVANMGVRAFLPASQVSIRRSNDLDPYVGKRLKVKIIELNRKRNRVIVSHRAVLEEEIKEQKAETMKKLEPGAQLDSEVVEITDFGVFVNLGGIDGLIHRSELSHGRFNHPREVVKLGDKIKVEIIDMDLERERINLSAKKLIADPWVDALETYAVGQKITGKVTNLTPFGAFVEIQPGLEGLIHVSEMSWTKRIRHPKEAVSENDEVEVMILKIDPEQQRISLGLRQTQPDPWSSLPDRFPPGAEVTGKITGLTDFGVFIEIEEGIEGLIHISELSHDHVDNIAEQFKNGDELTAVILNIDPVEQRASLSRKRLIPYTPSEGDEDRRKPKANRGNKGGRRGGRRSKGIDYDYSYAATDSNYASPKLGDVYADLFAQFGLAEGSEETKETKPKKAKAKKSKTAAKKPVESKKEAEPEVAPENAIDAAEAAALLTAAFREGKKPAAETDYSDHGTEAEEKTEEKTEETKTEATTETSSESVAEEVKTETVESTAKATTEAKTETTSDDLTRIEGIGPKMSAALIAQGINTFKKLESSDVETLKTALANEGIKFAPSTGTWAKQAEYLVNGDEEGFKEYTDYLVAGRDPNAE
ncbi:MAG TPA: 30S ribosomal protein S1 [Trueperaceae bacterium]|nr:30S ribosomal protein S1 [Trueperaceae bacterium]